MRSLLAVLLSLPGPWLLGQSVTAGRHEAIQRFIVDGNTRAAEKESRALLAELAKEGKSESLEGADTLDDLARTLAAAGSSTAIVKAETDRAAAIKAASLGPRHPAVAVTMSILADQMRRAGDYAGAISLFEAALAMQESNPSTRQLDIAETLSGYGLALTLSGKSERGVTVHQRAISIRQREAGDDYRTAIFMNNLATAYWQAGDLATAKVQAQRSLEIFEQQLGPDHFQAGVAVGNLASVIKQQGDYKTAKPLHQRAVAIYEARLGPDHPRLVTQLNNLAMCIQMMDEIQEAAALLERALAICLKRYGPDNTNTATVLANLGILYRASGDSAKARDAYERALAIQERRLGPNHSLVGSALHSLGNLLNEAGDYAEAKKVLARSLAINEKTTGADHPKTLEVKTSLALALLAGHEYGAARAQLESVLESVLRTTGPDSHTAAETNLHIGRLFLDMKDYGAARQATARSVDAFRKIYGEGHSRTARSLIQLGLIDVATGNFAQAVSRLEPAIEVLTRSRGAGNPALAEPLAALSRAYAQTGRAPEAMATANRSARIWSEGLRIMVQTLSERQALRLASFENRGSDEALTLAASGAEPKEAWNGVIRGRAVVLDEMAARGGAAARSGDPELGSLETQLRQARQRMARLAVQGPGEGKEEAAYVGRMQAASAKVEELEKALGLKSAEFRRTLESRRIGYAEVAAALPAGSALISYVHYRKQSGGRGEAMPAYAAFILRAGEAGPAVVDLGAAATVDTLVTAWRAEIRREADSFGRNAASNEQAYRAAGARLRRAVWDPLVARLADTARVFVVPDGALQLVNFNTLPFGTRSYLVERGMALHTMSSERDLAGTDSAKSRGLLAMGNAAFEPGAVPNKRPISRGSRTACGDYASLRFEPLPGSGREVDSIVSIWRKRGLEGLLLTGAMATEARLKADAPGKQVVHLATHGFFLNQNCAASGLTPRNSLLNSGLAFAGANHRRSASADEEDGILTGEEVASLRLDGTEWVVLSGCDTGAGEALTSEGVLGLRRAFRVAGARTLVASLWPVEDEAAREWMTALYRARFEKNRTTAEAVSEATISQLWQRRAKGLSTHPFHWGGFVAVGDWH